MICAETIDDSEIAPKKDSKVDIKKKEDDSETEQKKDLKMNNKKKEDDSETEPKKDLKMNNKKKEKISKSNKEEIKVKKEKKKINELKESYKSREDKDECISHLYNFYEDLKHKDLDNLINKDNVKYFQKLNQENNIQIFLLLSKIYNKIFNSEDFYKNFFSEDQDENKEKIPLVINLLEESIKIIDIFKDNVLSLEFFQLKENLLKLIKFMHINLKESLADKEKEQLSKLINEIPNKFFSNNYLEIIKYKNTIYKNNKELLKNIGDIDKLFFELESYYEQLSCLELLFNNIEPKGNKNKFNNYSSISNDDIKNENEKEQIINEKNENANVGNEQREYSDNEIILYGQFLRKICIYQNFLLKKIKEINKNEEKENESKENKEVDEDIENENENEDIESKKKIDSRKTLSLFIIDVIKNVNGKIQSQSNENIELEDLLNNRICISLKEQNNIYDIIKKNIDNFNQLLTGSNNQEIKSIKKKLDNYLSSINNDKYIPINIEKIDNIKYYSNFSRNKIIVPYGDSRIFYIENKEDKKGLLLVEFYVTDETKDIVFKINKYESSSNDYKNVYNTGKLNKKCNLCVYFEEQSLYQIEFDNKYSWMNSKEVNFTISLFRIIDKDKSEINNENNINNLNNIDNDNSDIISSENNQKNEKNNANEFKISKAVLNNEKIIKFFCHNIDTNYTFNCNKIYEKIKEKQMSESNDFLKNKEFNLSILVYLNKIRIVTFDNNDKINYTEIIEENEKLITKTFFNKIICKYLNENYKIEENEHNNKNKNISINLFCLNRNLSFVSNKVKELIDALNSHSINNIVKNKNKNKIYEQFLQKLGFYPDEKLDKFKIIYNLYDFSDQCLIYHLFLNHIQEKYVESSTLILIFDKFTVSASALNEGAIFNKFKSLEKSWRQKFYSNLKMNDFKSIVYFIKAVSDSFDGLDLVLCYMDNDDKKDDLLNLFKQIKEYVQKNIYESINVYIYHEDNFIRKIFKYIGLFINE